MSRVSTRRMNAGRKEFFEAGKQLDASEFTRHLANCWICGMRINYDVPANSTPDSHNLDHFYPVSTHPEMQEDPANWRHSHAECNVGRGADAPLPGIGILSRAW